MSFKNFASYITAAAVIVTALFSLTGCEFSEKEDDADKGRNYWFSSVINGSPATLDPQTCADDSSAQIIGNVFTGLFAFSDGGEVVPAMAEEYTVSDDGLTWEFKLRDDIWWYGKDDFKAQCTAEDFVFGFRRLVNPALRSQRAKEYYCIRNAEPINTGKITNLNKLGVEATEKFRLKITLETPRSDLRSLLAAAPAMPCNEEYYMLTEGQYGLTGDSVGSNGDFYVSRWFYDKWVRDGNFIELRRNELNYEALNTAPRGVTFHINADDYEWFLNGDVQICRTADSEEIFRLSGKYEHTEYSTAVWGLIFNTAGVFSSSDLRTALGSCKAGETDGSIYTSADCIVPEGVDLGGTDYRSAAGKPDSISYTESELIERGRRAMRGLEEGTLSGMKILMPEGTSLKQSAGAMIQQWQRNYGIYCMISELPYDSYIQSLLSGDFDVAMIRLSGGGNGAVDYLNVFSSASSRNYGKVNNKKLEDILQSVRTADNAQKAAVYCLEAEQLILDNFYFVPVCFEKEYLFLAGGVSGIGYDPFSGSYLYRNALKK